MDLDAVHRQVQGLVKFRTQVEAFLANAGHDLAAEAADMSLGTRLTSLEETVTGVQKELDELGPKLADLPALLAGVNELLDLKDRLLAAADWIDQNKEQVAALVQIGDDLAGIADPSGTGGTVAVKPASPGPGGGGGAGSAAVGASGTSGDTASSAGAPGAGAAG